MKQMLIFGDSNVWGYIPGTFNPNSKSYQRYSQEQRWPALLQKNLAPEWRVIEEGLPGRTIMAEDPEQPELNGLTALRACLEKNKLDLVVVMLGLNDLQAKYQLSAVKIAEQMQEFLEFIPSQVLLIAPPLLHWQKLSLEWRSFYQTSVDKEAQQLTRLYAQLAHQKNYLFCDASLINCHENSDGLHLNAAGHSQLTKLILRESLCHN